MLDEIRGLVVIGSKSMLLFHSPTGAKVGMIVGLSLIMFMCLQQMQNCWHPQLGVAMKCWLHLDSEWVQQRKAPFRTIPSFRAVAPFSNWLLRVGSIIELTPRGGLQHLENCWRPQLAGSMKFRTEASGMGSATIRTLRVPGWASIVVKVVVLSWRVSYLELMCLRINAPL